MGNVGVIIRNASAKNTEAEATNCVDRGLFFSVIMESCHKQFENDILKLGEKNATAPLTTNLKYKKWVWFDHEIFVWLSYRVAFIYRLMRMLSCTFWSRSWKYFWIIRPGNPWFLPWYCTLNGGFRICVYVFVCVFMVDGQKWGGMFIWFVHTGHVHGGLESKRPIVTTIESVWGLFHGDYLNLERTERFRHCKSKTLL